jgi:hypothetical protein
MTLKHTLEQVRDAEVARIGTKGRPNPWWPGGPSTNDCVGYQTVQLGLRTGHETLAQLNTHREWISIAAFRAHYQWPEHDLHETSFDKMQPGDLVLSNWDGGEVDGELEAEHMEWVYSVDHDARSFVIVGANTGPRPGDSEPAHNGVWKKTRPFDGHIRTVIHPPYVHPAPSLARKAEVRRVGALVNKTVPNGLPRTNAAKTGIEDRAYRLLVQTWGRMKGYYGSGYIIDGIFGPQSRIVEAAADKAARAKK